MLKTDIEEERKRQKDRKIEQRKDRATESQKKQNQFLSKLKYVNRQNDRNRQKDR